MTLSNFLDAYTKSGHVLLEKAGYVTQENVNQWLGMFASLEGGQIPTAQGPVPPDQAIKNAIASPGTPVKAQDLPVPGKPVEPGKEKPIKVKFYSYLS